MTSRAVLLIHSFTQALPNGSEVDVSVTFSGYYDPGCSYGLPENCYPAESEVSVLTASTEETGDMDFDDWVTKMGLSAKDVASIEEKLLERVREENDETRSDD